VHSRMGKKRALLEQKARDRRACLSLKRDPWTGKKELELKRNVAKRQLLSNYKITPCLSILRGIPMKTPKGKVAGASTMGGRVPKLKNPPTA